MGTILGFHPSVVTSPPVVDEYEHACRRNPRLEDLTMEPSATVQRRSNIDHLSQRGRQRSGHEPRIRHSLCLHGRRGASRRRRQSRIVVEDRSDFQNARLHGLGTVHIQYLPLLYKEFGSFFIDTRDDTGTPVSFQRGKVTVTLHFRWRKTGLF